ncbi:MAG: prepilin peptidase [Deltaproteobacteria bacterium]|nr:MAG: prepilin peptidase [Deltaproteobacteria bacterium]
MSSTQILILLASAFLLGAIIGSFLNVCIYRIPAGESVVAPRSRCPHCQTPIRWYHNLPVLSWVLLRGRCAYCRAPFSVRYPLIEALTGLLFALFLYRFGLHPATLAAWLLVATLVTITFIDIDHQIIPDVISLPGIPIGFLCSFAFPWVSWQSSLLGMLLGGGVLLAIALGYEWLTGQEGMGFGDVKLLAMLGAFLGAPAILPVIFLASVMGTLVGVPLMLVKRAGRRLALPFGPFLAAAALVYLYFVATIEPVARWYGEALVFWWRSLF